MVLSAILTGLVILLQFMGQFIRLGPYMISLVLIPIVIGAAVGGAKIGGWLGFVFGIVVLITDAAAFLAISSGPQGRSEGQSISTMLILSTRVHPLSRTRSPGGFLSLSSIFTLVLLTSLSFLIPSSTVFIRVMAFLLHLV